MAITYSEYQNKRLNEVVFLGSHDAGINQGNANAKTQTGTILEQAQNGARFFDLRIGAFSNADDTVSMRAYHDDTKIKVPSWASPSSRKLAIAKDATRTQTGMTVHKNMFGVKALGLHQMLLDAKKFVTDEATEFLMLKFDKCSNWPLVARACTQTLEDTIFTMQEGSICLNELTLQQLSGHVIVLFSSEGCQNSGDYKSKDGILEWKNLYKSSASSAGLYKSKFTGLQYYGKGGVSAGASGQSGKIESNRAQQWDIARGHGAYKQKVGGIDVAGKKFFQKTVTRNHAGVSPNVVGLMYWTTTGPSIQGIESRNTKMWSYGNQHLLVSATGLASEMVPSSVNPSTVTGAAVVKRFMPNFIMVDFVTNHKGKLVKELNTRNPAQILAVIESENEI